MIAVIGYIYITEGIGNNIRRRIEQSSSCCAAIAGIAAAACGTGYCGYDARRYFPDHLVAIIGDVHISQVIGGHTIRRTDLRGSSSAKIPAVTAGTCSGKCGDNTCSRHPANDIANSISYVQIACDIGSEPCRATQHCGCCGGTITGIACCAITGKCGNDTGCAYFPHHVIGKIGYINISCGICSDAGWMVEQ